MRHIALIVLSTKQKFNREPKYFRGPEGFGANCIETNETPLKYLNWLLKKQEGCELNSVYAFATEDALSWLKEFEGLFPGQAFYPVPMKNQGDLAGAFGCVRDMFELLQSTYSHCKDEITIHVDMTGGPRHANMLMLALIQMLKFNRFKLGQVVYSNLINKQIEDCRDIVDMYDLISGTQEFLSFGSVKNIQSYFASKPKSKALTKLLEAMEDLDAALEICASLESLEQVLQRLKTAVEEYKLNLQDITLGEQEMFFGQLLPMLEQEYGDILLREAAKADAMKLIRWCLERDFLQQGMTLYTEWLPLYLFEKRLLVIKSQEIQEECSKANMQADWKHWNVAFIRDFVPKYLPGELLGLKGFKSMITRSNFDINVIKKLVDPKNTVFFKVIQELLKLDGKRYPTSEITGQNNTYLPRKIFLKKYNKELENSKVRIDFRTYVGTKLLSGEKSSAMLLKQIAVMSNEELLAVFEAKAEDFPDSGAMDPGEKRKMVFEGMLEANYIELAMPKGDFLELLGDYMYCVNNWRNTSNHASAEAQGKAGNEIIKQAILKGLQLLEGGTIETA